MTFAWTPYALSQLIATCIVAALAIYVFERREAPAGSTFFRLLVAIAVWLGFETLQVLGADVYTKVRLGRSCYPAVVMLGPGIYMVALRSRDPYMKLSPRMQLFVYGVAVSTIGVVLFDHEVPGLIYAGFTLDPHAPYAKAQVVRGPWFWAIAAHTYLLVLLAGRTIHATHGDGRGGSSADGRILLLGVSAPLITSVAHIAGFEPIPYIDPLPVGFTCMSLLFAWGFKRSGMLTLMGTGRRLIIDAMGDGVITVDANRRLRDINLAARRIFDLQRSNVESLPIGSVFSNHPAVASAFDAWEASERSGAGSGRLSESREVGEIDLVVDGHSHCFSMRITPLRDSTGKELSRVLVLSDVTERKASEQRIRELAYFDPLTGLANRQLFRQRLESALLECERYGRTCALLFIDLDGFKVINDTLGHSAGDQVLRLVAERFSSSVRESDLLGVTAGASQSLSRLGGDEFTLLLTSTGSAQDAGSVARRLIQRLAPPCVISGSEVFIGASVGIAIYPGDGVSAEELLGSADAAMYEAKRRGANQIQYYAPIMNNESRRRLQIESALRRAIERDHLQLHYQPQRSTSTGRIIGVEALCRLHDDELGHISPGEFIPIAERVGLINLLGAWVLERACRQGRAWQLAGHAPIRMAVNVSGQQIRSGEFAPEVAHILRGTEFQPEWLELELTESAIAGEDPVTHETLLELRDQGISLALDDFGTGSSSLTHLRTLPMGRVKIDRSFVRDIPEDPDDVALTAAIIAMAHGLNREVIAEGVETEEQAGFLMERHCDALQGFLIGRPMPAAQVEKMLARELAKDDDTNDGFLP